ncbi:Vegetative incompatibility protein HET-E-1 [Colletotrichum gloeosporioides]|uniref:Vegetative incompatibility protein HET-E-1 n=1 Tax=Colletotrichum gloeosporioides TaxID=474922 RepID=A0A8H4FHR1_COLGL|nr:Vegetative incompatibility protein HET-E-1 [Colletotrichum gloeosporioides]KAF3801424.1 Vegetative incompatibility protein HET-E-1 [Colletotrichum gloeosporioides]
MLLLNTTTLHLEDFPDPSAVKYAILSHTWGKDEVSYKDLKDFPRAKRQAGFAKIVRTCELALVKHKLHYAWVDTCCINKASSAELSEAINSMFSWYRHATVCFVWLEDLAPVQQAAELSLLPENPSYPTSGYDGKLYDISEMGSCKWFKRGWTLQELIAPRRVEFYDASWEFRFKKRERTTELSLITGIDEEVLKKRRSLKDVLVGVKMSWAADRRTSRLEDLAYCLLGIFGINMPMLYGEGHNAFKRLQEHIVSQHRDESLFAWQSCNPPDQDYRGVFARSPEEFKVCSRLRKGGHFMFSTPGFSMTNKGVKFTTEALKVDNDAYFVMRLGIQCDNCEDRHDVHICLLRTTKGHVRVSPHECWRPPAGGGLSPRTKIYCCKDVTLHESRALERLALSPLRVSLDIDQRNLLSVQQYPSLAWDPNCSGFCGDALAGDFSGVIIVYTNVVDVLTLTLLVHKLKHEDDPDVELYAAPQHSESPWKVIEGCSPSELYKGARLDDEKLLEDYKEAKLSRAYQPRRMVKLERSWTPERPPMTATFEAKVEGLHVIVSLVVTSGSGLPVVQAYPAVQAVPIIQGYSQFLQSYGFPFQDPNVFQCPPEFDDTENDGEQDDGDDWDDTEVPDEDGLVNLSITPAPSYPHLETPPSTQKGPTADPRFTPAIPTSSRQSAYNTPKPERQESSTVYGYNSPSRASVATPIDTPKRVNSDGTAPHRVRDSPRMSSKQDQINRTYTAEYTVP